MASPTARGAGRGPDGARKVDDRGIEPRFTAVSERRLPSQPVVDSVGTDRNAANADFRSRKSLKPAAVAAGSLRQHSVGTRRRQGIAPCLPGSQPGGSLLAVRRSLAGRSRTPVPHGRSVVLTTELRRERTPSTGVEPASPGRQPGRVSRRVRGRAVMQYPERESNPRFRCERPASSTVRRSGHGGANGCDGWGRTSIRRVTTGRPTVERRRSEMDAPARIERAHVGSKPTALLR